MTLWYEYRLVWSKHPWLLVYAVIVAAVLALSIVATFIGQGPLILLFVPALAGVYVHHLMIKKRADRT